MAAIGFLGLLLLSTGASPLGLLLLGVVAVFVAVKILQVVGRNQAAASTSRRQAEEADQWRRRLPEALVDDAPDALAEVRRLTAAGGGTAYLGVTPDFREWATVAREQAVLVLGPPRSGKTSALIVPSLLVAPGPAVSTSTKTDVLHATAAARSSAGRVWLFDPSGTETVPDGVLELHWSPVHSARTWDGARLIADAMVDASATDEGVENGRYWSESAKGLLAPALHAAALSGRSIADVRRWITRMELDEAADVLDRAGAATAADDLAAVERTEDRERSSVFATARVVLGAYGSDAAAVRSERQNFDAAAFVRSRDTVYVTAPSHLQNVLAPLVVGLLEEIRIETYRFARERGPDAPQPPPVFWALDEIANIAPLKKLPSIVSEAGGQGLQIMACFQDLSQASVRWKRAADGFLTLFGTKIVFPGIGDRRTLESLSMMVGDWDRPYTCVNASTGQSMQFGFPLGFGVGTQYGTGHQVSARREALLSPSEISTIPQGTALMVTSGRWGMVEATPYHRARTWQRALSCAPPMVVTRGGVDVLPPAPVLAAEATPPNPDRRKSRWIKPEGRAE